MFLAEITLEFLFYFFLLVQSSVRKHLVEKLVLASGSSLDLFHVEYTLCRCSGTALSVDLEIIMKIFTIKQSKGSSENSLIDFS